MKIAQICPYTAPAKDSMGSERVIERLTKGLIELGHEVVMKLNPDSVDTPAPLVDKVPEDCDILHFHGWDPKTSRAEYDAYGIPYVVTMHGGGTESDAEWLTDVCENPHIICVSKFISDRLQCPAFVHSCTHPSEVIFGTQKDDYFLWMAGTDWGESKGLFSTIMMAKKMRFKLIIAGTGQNKQMIEQIKSFEDDRIKYVGPINGMKKAITIAAAKGFILLTQLPDACPATVSEALMSGTPLITSGFGAMPELMDPKVGFICETPSDFAKAVASVGKINPADCRNYAMENFSHTVAAQRYTYYYENMIKYGDVAGAQTQSCGIK